MKYRQIPRRHFFGGSSSFLPFPRAATPKSSTVTDASTGITTYRESKRVPHRAELLYQLVHDVDRYSEFLPWCLESRVLEGTRSTGKEDGVHRMQAELHVGLLAVRERYTSHVEYQRGPRAYHVKAKGLASPLFQLLESSWTFTPVPRQLPARREECTVDFLLRYKFTNALQGQLMASMFASANSAMMQAFLDRAKVLEGRNR